MTDGRTYSFEEIRDRAFVILKRAFDIASARVPQLALEAIDLRPIDPPGGGAIIAVRIGVGGKRLPDIVVQVRSDGACLADKPVPMGGLPSLFDEHSEDAFLGPINHALEAA